MTRRTELVIFDLDGTLVDSEANYLAAEQRLLEELGITGFDEAAKRPYVGMSTREMLVRLVDKHGISEPVESLAARKDGYYLELARAQTRVFEPMEQFVEALAARGYRLALASGSSPAAIDAVLEVTGLSRYFELAESAESVDRGKPEPDLFLEVASRLGVAPARCVVVEDSSYGRQAARRAGMSCIFVPGVPEQLRDPAETAGELVFAGGPADFSPARVLDWVRTN
jgi:HAD superfamily hydrolase (TIGR01509 family)